MSDTPTIGSSNPLSSAIHGAFHLTQYLEYGYRSFLWAKYSSRILKKRPSDSSEELLPIPNSAEPLTHSNSSSVASYRLNVEIGPTKRHPGKLLDTRVNLCLGIESKLEPAGGGGTTVSV
jgi:hypothetical protein